MSSSSKSSGSTATKTTAAKQQQQGQAQPVAQGQTCVPHDKIAMRAYSKWQQRGCPCGTDMQDWQEAEAELKAEVTKTTTPATAAPAKATQQQRR